MKISPQKNEVESDQNSNGLDLASLFFAVYSKKWHIIAASVLVTSATYFFVQFIPARYQATATMLFDGNHANLVSIRDVYEVSSQRREFLMTQAEILQSRSIAEHVVDTLNLTDHPDFNKNEKGWSDSLKESIGLVEEYAEKDPVVEKRRKRDAIINVIQSGVRITPVRNTLLIKISFEADSSRLAADVPNAISEAYIAQQQGVRVDVTEKATNWLSERLAGLKSKLEESEQILNEFQQKEDLVDLQGVRGLASQELNDSMDRLLEAKREYKQAQLLYEQVGVKKIQEDALLSVPEVLNHPMVQTARAAEVQALLGVTELSRRYGPKHPTMLAAQDELGSARAQLRSEVKKLVASIEINYQRAKSKVSALENELTGAKAQLQSVARKEIQYDELKREVDVNLQLYNTFLTRFKETREVSGFEAAAARLTDPAVPPRSPIASKKRLLVLFAFVASAGMTAGVFILMDLLKAGIRDPRDISDKLGQKMMGLVPEVSDENGGDLPIHAYFDSKHSRFSEAIRSLRTAVVLSHFGTDAKVISVTSSAPGEGKTTVSLNLALSLSQLEKVLLIDADMRRPSIASRLDVAPSRPGLADILAGHFLSKECIFSDKRSGLDVIASGSRPEDPQRLLGSANFNMMLKELLGLYDRIVIDTPPVQAVSDALVISKVSNSLLYVVKADDTRLSVVRAGLSRLSALGVRPDGIVLNCVKVSKSRLYGESYYGYYSPEYV